MRRDRAMFNLDYDRIADDFYPTEAWVTRALLQAYDIPDFIWEPCAGDGAICQVLNDFDIQTIGTDLVYRGYPIVKQMDFLKFTEPPHRSVKGIVTNPPYYKDTPERFIIHSCNLMQQVKGVVAFLCRHEYICAKRRNYLFDPNYGFACSVVLVDRPRWVRESSGSPRHNYSWYIWDYRDGRKVEDPIIRFGREE